MKPYQIDRSSLQNKSFTVKRHLFSHFLKIWHYHNDLELVMVLGSTGTRFIGDSIEKFDKGDLVLIGKNLPHMWLNDDIYFEESSSLKAEAIAIHFKENFLGYDFFTIPEMMHISELFKKARYGVKFINVDKKIIQNIKNILNDEGFERMMKFIRILDFLAKHPKYELLANESYINSIHKTESKNLDKIYEYIFKNFNTSISLNTVAQIANMNPSAFSRLFKRVNQKTFTKYLNEVRIGYACKLLIENKYNISEICYESGFNNISNFNRQFKNITNYSPTEYIKLHIKLEPT